MSDDAIDVVFTWVDDSFPGYLDLLNQHANDKRDLNPNRTRDNLQLLRYAMRSVARHMPWVRNIYLFTCRPQVPDWLNVDHPQIRLVHHDQVMAAEHLPSFSSFGIVSHLHLLPELSERFLYFEDDFLCNSSDLRCYLQAPDGRPIVNLGRHWIAPMRNLNPATSSPWNLALANADAVLSRNFGPGPRRQTLHGPQMFTKTAFQAAIDAYPAIFEATRANKFRNAEAVPPEVFIPHYMVETGQAVLADRKTSQRVEGYVSLENIAPWTWAQLKGLDFRQPLSIALNDSFGDRPNLRVERLVKFWLQKKFPVPSPWEKP